MLIVERDEAVALELARQLETLGYRSDVARTSGEAIALARRQSYRVAFIATEMHGVEGHVVVDAIGAASPSTVFLCLSEGKVLRPSTLHNAAVVGLITKPLDREELAAKLSVASALYDKRTSSKQKDERAELSVLIVEDDPSDVLLISHAVTKIGGISGTVAETLREGTRILHDRAFDVIMTDLSLPDARGVDAVVRLRSAGPESAIIVCSELDDEALSLQLLQIGAQEYLPKSRLFTDELSRLLMRARERKRFELRLARLAYYDPLTGLSNRAGWHEHASAALMRACRARQRAAVLMLDLDGFKQVNDSLGHDTGDALLQDFGRILHGSIREYDTVARLGGDEFALFLSDIEQGARIDAIARRILGQLRETVRAPGLSSLGVSTSIGVATYPDNGQTLAELVRAADHALYEAKRSGKSRCVVATKVEPAQQNTRGGG